MTEQGTPHSDQGVGNGPAGTQPDRSPDHGRFVAFITSLPGIMTALATLIAAIAGAFFGGKTVGQNSSSAPPSVVATTVTVTAPAAATAASSSQATTSNSGPTTSDSPAPSSGIAAGQAFLAATQDVGEQNMNALSAGPVKIGADTFPNSVRFVCTPNGFGTGQLTYSVAGYKHLDVTLGIPTDAQNVAGVTVTWTFLKDGSTILGVPVSTVVGSKPKVHLDLQGSTQLEIACKPVSSSGTGARVDVALGDATLTSS